MQMKLVYIAGPYRADTDWGVECNIHRAQEAAARVWMLEAVAVCPHKNSERLSGVADERVFLQGGLELLKRCDAVLAIDGWEKSEGAMAEHAAARDLRIPWYTDIAELAEFLETRRGAYVSQCA